MALSWKGDELSRLGCLSRYHLWVLAKEDLIEFLQIYVGQGLLALTS